MKCKIMCAALVMMSATLTAQDTAKILEEIIVTATKSPIKQSETGKVVNVITQAQLQKSFGKSLSDVLNQAPGININGAGNTLGTNQTIYIRGASSSNTLILLDGAPLYDASGIGNEFDLNNFALDNIERIEILKGSQSTLYGSDAVAGVINIITKKGEKTPFNLNLNLSAGSYNTYKGSVSASGSNGKGQTYFVAYNKIYSKGFSSANDSTGKNNYDRDGFNQDAFMANFGFKPFKKTTVRLFGKYNNNKADIDAGAFKDDRDYTFNNKNTMAGTSIDYKLKDGFIRLQYNYNHYNRSFTDDSSHVGGFSNYQRGKYNSNSHFAELFTSLQLTKNIEWLAGVDYRQNSTSQTYIFLPDYGFPATPLSSDSAKTSQFSGYASVNVKAEQGFNMELGGRWNHHNIYGSNFTYSFNPYFLIKGHYKIYGSISSGYRVPSLYQLYSEYGNKDLNPETTTSYEAGIQYFSEKIYARATGFIREGRDVFLFYTNPATYASQYINGDQQKDYGLETELGVNFTKQFSASASYTFVDGAISTKNNSEGKDTSFFNLYKRPKNTFNLSLNYQVTENLFLSADLKTVSKAFEPQYMATPFELKGYYTIGFYGQYQFNKNIIIFIDVENLTDQTYYETRGFNTTGLNANGGVRITLQ